MLHITVLRMMDTVLRLVSLYCSQAKMRWRWCLYCDVKMGSSSFGRRIQNSTGANDYRLQRVAMVSAQHADLCQRGHALLIANASKHNVLPIQLLVGAKCYLSTHEHYTRLKYS